MAHVGIMPITVRRESILTDLKYVLVTINCDVVGISKIYIGGLEGEGEARGEEWILQRVLEIMEREKVDVEAIKKVKLEVETDLSDGYCVEASHVEASEDYHVEASEVEASEDYHVEASEDYHVEASEDNHVEASDMIHCKQ